MATMTHINPESMHRNPAFTQAVRVPSGHDLVVIGGQNGVDATGQIVAEDLAGQTKQALRNLLDLPGRRRRWAGTHRALADPGQGR